MMNPLDYVRALYLFLTNSLESKLPSLGPKRAISPVYAIAIIAVIIAAGGLIIYFLVVAPSSTTTTVYPP